MHTLFIAFSPCASFLFLHFLPSHKLARNAHHPYGFIAPFILQPHAPLHSSTLNPRIKTAISLHYSISLQALQPWSSCKSLTEPPVLNLSSGSDHNSPLVEILWWSPIMQDRGKSLHGDIQSSTSSHFSQYPSRSLHLPASFFMLYLKQSFWSPTFFFWLSLHCFSFPSPSPSGKFSTLLPAYIAIPSYWNSMCWQLSLNPTHLYYTYIYSLL